MATAPKVAPGSSITQPGVDSRALILSESSNEFVFAVVGHAGSGTSLIAEQLSNILREHRLKGVPFDVIPLKATDVIAEWGRDRGIPIPTPRADPNDRRLEDALRWQDLGDQMRAEEISPGCQDHAAIARRLILRVRTYRAQRQGQTLTSDSEKVVPDGRPRAYILDSIRHPAEVRLLRHVYREAFVLLGVVCEEQKRRARLSRKYGNAGERDALSFMARDAHAVQEYGQRVEDAFYLADFFVDNTVDRTLPDRANPEWDIVERLSRLVKILTHSELLRPTPAETAMYHAYGARMRSACLSRQVGAALADSEGHVLATGTNEVPKAGGGVYSGAPDGSADAEDARCGLFADPSKRYCRNTREQNRIVTELIGLVPELAGLLPARKDQLVKLLLEETSLGRLLEFSRAIHAEMDALLSAARTGVSLIGTKLYVTTFPCHYCARHIVAAGVDEVQYIEPYPKSQALQLHTDAIALERSQVRPTPNSTPQYGRVLFHPFSGVAPGLYKRAFFKDRELKDRQTGTMRIEPPSWGTPWHLSRISYPELEARLAQEMGNG